MIDKQLIESAGDPSRYTVKTQRDPAVKFWANIKKRNDAQKASQDSMFHGTKQTVPPVATLADFVGLMTARAVGGKKLVPDMPNTQFVKTQSIKESSDYFDNEPPSGYATYRAKDADGKNVLPFAAVRIKGKVYTGFIHHDALKAAKKALRLTNDKIDALLTADSFGFVPKAGPHKDKFMVQGDHAYSDLAQFYVKEDAQRTYKAKEFTPAVRVKSKIFRGGVGDFHSDILNRLKPADADWIDKHANPEDHIGYVHTATGKFYGANQVSKKAEDDPYGANRISSYKDQFHSYETWNPDHADQDIVVNQAPSSVSTRMRWNGGSARIARAAKKHVREAVVDARAIQPAIRYKGQVYTAGPDDQHVDIVMAHPAIAKVLDSYDNERYNVEFGYQHIKSKKFIEKEHVSSASKVDFGMTSPELQIARRQNKKLQIMEGSRWAGGLVSGFITNGVLYHGKLSYRPDETFHHASVMEQMQKLLGWTDKQAEEFMSYAYDRDGPRPKWLKGPAELVYYHPERKLAFNLDQANHLSHGPRGEPDYSKYKTSPMPFKSVVEVWPGMPRKTLKEYMNG